MDLSSKEAGDVFRLKLYGIEYDVKVVGDDEDPLMFCKDCIFFNNSERCSLSESQDWCLKKQVVYCKIRHDGGNLMRKTPISYGVKLVGLMG